MKILHENILKNVILLIILWQLYYQISDFLLESGIVWDGITIQTTLIVISLISVIACFSAFTVTYGKTNMKKTSHRLLGHFTTASMLLILGICIIFTDVLFTMLLGSFVIVHTMLALLYVGCVSFDFWDIMK
jgi:hypothetical protein